MNDVDVTSACERFLCAPVNVIAGDIYGLDNAED